MSQDNNYSRGPVPLAARKGVVPLTFVMLGLTFFRQYVDRRHARYRSFL